MVRSVLETILRVKIDPEEMYLRERDKLAAGLQARLAEGGDDDFAVRCAPLHHLTFVRKRGRGWARAAGPAGSAARVARSLGERRRAEGARGEKEETQGIRRPMWTFPIIKKLMQKSQSLIRQPPP